MLDGLAPRGAAIYAVYPHRRYLPAKIRVFVDYLVQWFKERECCGAKAA